MSTPVSYTYAFLPNISSSACNYMKTMLTCFHNMPQQVHVNGRIVTALLLAAEIPKQEKYLI